MVPGRRSDLVGILDMDMGNLRSVSNAVYNLGFDFEIIRDAQELASLSHLIIPGVGAYSAAVRSIESLGLREPILTFAASGRPILGICLGMQVLSSKGEEGGATEGLGLVPGSVSRLTPGGDLAIPHVGWNNIRIASPHPLLAGVKTGVDFYFVHSYGFACDSPTTRFATTEYGIEFDSIVGHENVAGVQFHAEKSQVNGLRIIENFCRWDGEW